MCQQCQALCDKYLPGIEPEKRRELLWEATCFPFGGPEHLEPQLAAIARRKVDGYPWEWVWSEIALAHAEMDAARREPDANQG